MILMFSQKTPLLTLGDSLAKQVFSSLNNDDVLSRYFLNSDFVHFCANLDAIKADQLWFLVS